MVLSSGYPKELSFRDDKPLDLGVQACHLGKTPWGSDIEKNQSLDWKKCCSIILKMVQFRALKFNIVINPDIGLILIWYWWWYWSDIDLDIDLILIWYWSGIDLILIWYSSDIDLYWSWCCMIFHLVLANTGETKVKPRWNCFPVNLWLSLKPSNLFRVA